MAVLHRFCCYSGLFQNSHQHIKHFGTRSGTMYYCACSGSKLFWLSAALSPLVEKGKNYLYSKNIRIYHECEGRIEKSVPRITVWHHEACRVMTNCDPEGQIFLSYPHTNIGFFFLLTSTVLYLKISFQKSLNTLRYNFT